MLHSFHMFSRSVRDGHDASLSHSLTGGLGEVLQADLK